MTSREGDGVGLGLSLLLAAKQISSPRQYFEVIGIRGSCQERLGVFEKTRPPVESWAIGGRLIPKLEGSPRTCIFPLTFVHVRVQ